MLTTAGPQLRSGAVGFTLAVAFAGVLHAVTTLSLRVMLPGGFMAWEWEGPRWAMSAALLLAGVAGVTARVSRRGGPVAALLAIVSAVGVVAAVLWTVDLSLLWAGSSPWLIRSWFAGQAVLVTSLVAVAWVWARTAPGPARGTAVTLGAVVGTAVAQLPRLVEQVEVLPMLRERGEGTFAVVWIAAGVLVLVAAVLSVLALLDRVPVTAVATLVVVAGLLLLVHAVRDATTMSEYLAGGGVRAYASTLLALLVEFAHTVLALGLGGLLLGSARRASRAGQGYGPDSTAARHRPPTP